MTYEPMSHGREEYLLFASIAVDGQHNYGVTLIAAPGGMAQHHYVRFTLHYYARAVYELAKAGTSVGGLTPLIDLILRFPLERDCDLFVLAGIDATVSTTVPSPVAHSELALRDCGARECELIGEVTLEGRDLAHSVIAVMQYVSDRLSDEALTGLSFALKNMNASYAAAVNRQADPLSQIEVPRKAFRAVSSA